jgi:cobalt-zinc-cadmium resistance protein CzcA
MITRLIELAVGNRVSVLLATVLLTVVGGLAAMHLPIDAVPDITSPQVQINTSVPALAPEEVEKQVTLPIESNMAGLPGMVELRSLSRFGLSQVTMTFEDHADIYRLRQLVSERLQGVLTDLPAGVDVHLAPISTGLSEIFYYAVRYKADAPGKPATEFDRLLTLSTIQEYLIKPILRATPGLAEVNTSGGYEKQLVVIPNPTKLDNAGITIDELGERLRENAENAGGGFVEIGGEQIIIRAATRVQSREDILALPLKFGATVEALTVGDVAEVSIGSSFRAGASTEQGEEAVVGAAIMLLGENTRTVAEAVRTRLAQIQDKLPEGVEIVSLYDRGDLVANTIHTVEKNLFEGAVLVAAVLFAMLGNFRAACIVALAIPLSMLFALTGMVQNRISGNLMSLGAIDFGLIVDGAVVMVENIVRHLAHRQQKLGRVLTAKERHEEVLISAKEVATPMFFGVLIIAIVYVPILTLTGIEGKMFHPMAYTVLFALAGALLLALTLMPVLCTYLLSGKVQERDSRLVSLFRRLYTPILNYSLRRRPVVVAISVGIFASSMFVFTRLGAEFIPQLNEGAVTIQFIRSTSLGLDASLELQKASESLLLRKFPEITHLFSKIGTAEIASDPMGPNVSDTFVFLSDEATWRKVGGQPVSKPELLESMKRELTLNVPGQTLLFSQPIQMRFNEMMAGARANLALKIYGAEFDELERLAQQATEVLKAIPGSGDVEFDAFGRAPMLQITPNRQAMKRLNVSAGEINRVIAAALAGEEVGTYVEENRPIPLVVRLGEKDRRDVATIKRLSVRTEDGGVVPLERVGSIELSEQVGTITRDATQRRATLLINPKGSDIEGFVAEGTKRLRQELKLAPGYFFEFGGQFENLQKAKARLSLVVPATLLLILLLIYLTFNDLRQALLIFLCVPLAVSGGVFALAIRGMPFSISAAVGFIALSGIAVLNGLMLLSFTNQLRAEGRPLREAMIESALTRLRPKLMTALVASLGFLPMAVATGAGAEVQRPLATVVIGGIITSTFLTLVLLPTLYLWIEGGKEGRRTLGETQ